ncbi:MAG: fasciclin domain-containing protein, partial [Anaerolineae bacterium]|nr:fasciclin domain-containing protein [Anaerolineae bacterium]
MNRRQFLKAAFAGAIAVGSMGLPSLPASAQAKDIVDTAVGAGSFKTLVAAVQAAGLVETLKGPGPFTVFAPTDEAFAKLPAGTVE